MKVLWAEMFPFELKARMRECPVVYLPVGLCEPHGQISAFGLDTFKAEHICLETAQRAGGVVAPTLAYHIHESGPSAKWLEEQVGDNVPHMTSVSPFAFVHFLLYQLRSFYNSGFRAAFIVSGHGGAHQEDLKKLVGVFAEQAGMKVWYGTDFDLTRGEFEPDHAGKYEISTLLHLRPDLIRFPLVELEGNPDSGGRLARADSALEATASYGEEILRCCVETLTTLVLETAQDLDNASSMNGDMLSYQQIESIWQRLQASADDWTVLRPRAGQQAVSAASRWKPYEYGGLK